jgi:hypothetical protein
MNSGNPVKSSFRLGSIEAVASIVKGIPSRVFVVFGEVETFLMTCASSTQPMSNLPLRLLSQDRLRPPLMRESLCEGDNGSCSWDGEVMIIIVRIEKGHSDSNQELLHRRVFAPYDDLLLSEYNYLCDEFE